MEATPNIAPVKYWGKRDEGLVLPAEGSISMTLDDKLRTRTSVEFSHGLREDEVSIDGEEVADEQRDRVVRHLDMMRKAAHGKLKARVVSGNSFPAASGLASSASGFAALTLACARALGMKEGLRKLSIIARMGSGSACRSVFGGFVEWKRGERSDGKDSYAVQLKRASHWPDIVDVIGIVQKGRKKVSSREGMRRTVLTSGLFKERLKMLPARLERVRLAIEGRDLDALLLETMADSDNMHACMRDAKPPLVYMNDVSGRIVDAIRQFNEGEVRAGYSFDAGPNAHVITTRKRAGEISGVLGEVDGVEEVILSGIGEGPRYM